MATIWGKSGLIKLGAVTVAKIIDFDFDEEQTPISDTAMGDTAETHIAGSGISKWSGSCTAHYDSADAAQISLTIGASVTLNLYPDGSTTGKKYRSGTATLTKRGQTQKMDGDTVRCTFTFQGSGPLGNLVAP